MSSEQTFSTSDLRSAAQDFKRDASHKHKWHLGSVQRVGQAPGNPRPFRPSETNFNIKRRETKGAVASLAHGTKIARKHDMLETTTNEALTEDSCSSGSDHSAPSSPPDAGIMYSFDAPRGPSHGSEILNSALAKAVQKFEEKETKRLVEDEYDIVDSEGESVKPAPSKKSKGKAKAETFVFVDEDEDYEFV